MKYQAYPAYKESGVEWLGRIPEGWKTLDLKFGSQIELSNIDKHTVDGEPPVQLCNYTDVYRNERITSNMAFMQATASVEQISRLKVQNGDVIITKDSESPDDIGISSFVEETAENLVCGYHLCLIRPTTEKFSGRLLHWFFSSYAAKTYFFTEAVGMTRFALGKYSIANTVIPLPPLPTQQVIAAFLDAETARIDGLIKDYEELVVLLQEKRQALISHAVTRGLSELVSPHDPEFGEWAKPVKFKDSGVEWLGEIPKGWKTLKLKAAVEYLTSGPRGWSERITDNGELFIQSGDLTSTGRLDFQNAMRVTVESDSEARRSQLRNGDVVVCITGAKTGNVALCEALNESAYVNQHLCLIRPRKGLHSSYLSLFLLGRSAQEYFSVTQYGLKQGLSLSNVSDIPILLPGLDEQAKIAQYIGMKSASFDELVTEAESAIELLKEHRSALITNAVTGKINVESFLVQNGGAA